MSVADVTEDAGTARSRRLGWLVPPVLVLLAFWPYTHLPAKTMASALIYDGLIVVAAVALLLAGVRQPAGARLPWLLAAGGLTSYVGGDTGWYVILHTTGAPPASASIADLGYLGYYPFVMAALLVLVRRRSPGRDVASLLDALIVATGFGLLIWVFVVLPTAAAGGMSQVAWLTAVCYPVMDLALLTVLARLVTARGARTGSFVLLVAAVATMLGSDTVYGLHVLAGTFVAGGWLDLGYPLAHSLLAAAALHPSVSALLRPMPTATTTRPTGTRLALLAAASLLAPTVSLLAPTAGQRRVAMVAAALLFLLVVGRLAALARDLARTEAHFRSLVSNAADLIIVLDAVGRPTYLSPSAERALHGMADGAPMTELVHPDDTAPVITAFTSARDHAAGSALVDVRLRDNAGMWRRYATVITNLLADTSVNGMVLNLRDVTDRTALETQLRELALHDGLTGLANRTLIIDRIDHALHDISRVGGQLAVLFVDLDGFKAVNDSLGHAAGDELLCLVANRLRGCLRPGDTAARLGGDEFAVLLPSVSDVTDAEQVTRRMIRRLRAPSVLGAGTVTVGASIGIALGTSRDNVDGVLRRADTAMYEAKRGGKDRYATAPAAPHPAGRRHASPAARA